MTTRDEARRTAMAYAWGREDQSGLDNPDGIKTPTVTPAGQISGDWAFSEAYAQGQDDLNNERRGDFIAVQDAWANWQASGGRSVFKRGELTLSDAQRWELRGLWPSFWDDDNDTSAYYARRDQMQDAAWETLAS